MEKWITSKQYPDYECSDLGRIKNKTTNKILKGTISNKGYIMVHIKNKKNISVHRLIAEAFIDNPENKPFINHIDGNKTNNNINNLEWCTHLENVRHMINTLHKNPGGRNKRSIRCVETNTVFESAVQAEKEMNIFNGTIIQCCNGKRKSTHGYHFEYANNN